MEYEYEFSNRIYLPLIITHQNNLIPNIWLLVSNGKGKVRTELAPRNSKVVLALVFALVVKSEGR